MLYFCGTLPQIDPRQGFIGGVPVLVYCTYLTASGSIGANIIALHLIGAFSQHHVRLVLTSQHRVRLLHPQSAWVTTDREKVATRYGGSVLDLQYMCWPVRGLGQA